MNDTQTSTRQERILEYLAEGQPKSRTEIQEDLFKTESISKVTLIRDLNELIGLGFVRSEGSGRCVSYTITDKYALLYPIDIDKYYKMSADNRVLKNPNFNFNIFNSFANILSAKETELFEEGKVQLKKSFSALDSTILKRELERFVIELSWKSSQIEGNTYSLLETEELIKNRKEAPGHTKAEATMILNHKEAFDTILEHRETYKDVSLHDLRSLHSVMVKGLDIAPGIRKHGVGITGTKYKPLDNTHQIEEALEKLFNTLKQVSAVPEKALILLAMISYIQPFGDGNKRTARMLSNAILLTNDYYPLSYRSVDEVGFKKALLLFYEQNNLYHLKRIFVDQQRFAVENYFA